MTILREEPSRRFLTLERCTLLLKESSFVSNKKKAKMTTKIAVCYWGMTRSVKQTYPSHFEHFYHILKQRGIEYKVFLHTWKTRQKNYVIWEHETTVPVDYEEYRLLLPDYFAIDDQDEFLNGLDFCDYFSNELYETYGGDTPHEWKPQLIKNHLCALESQKRVFRMVSQTDERFDYVVFLRPDVLITNDFCVDQLAGDFDILLPSYDHFEGYNDRFAVLPLRLCPLYANRIDEIKDFRKHHGRIVSEKYVKFIVEKYFQKVSLIDFQMTIQRP